MILRQFDLTTALRPSLLPEEILLFVQDNVGLYRDKYKIEGHQNGHAYLTSHRICYVDNEEPRQRSVAIDLKDVDHPELYAGFLKSSPKITLYPKTPKRQSLAVRTSSAAYNTPSYNSATSSPTGVGFTLAPASPAPPPSNATWICPICSFSNPVPSNFDPNTANASTPLPPCLACGIKPPLVHVTKAAIAALSNRSSSTFLDPTATQASTSSGPLSPSPRPAQSSSSTICPRCTFRNHPSLSTCEICGAPLPRASPLSQSLSPGTGPNTPRSASPAPTTILPPDPSAVEIVKLSFRSGASGATTFHDRLKEALIQRKWLLESAPAPPKPERSTPSPIPGLTAAPATPPPRRVGIAGLESRGLDQRKENELVMGSAFEDLEALMTSAKEVIALAERFAQSTRSGTGDDATVLQESASALGLVTRDMLSGAAAGSAAEKTYLTQLSRDLAEYLTDDRTGILRREGGIMTLVDLWAVFNRRRNGIELVSPRDFYAACDMWEGLRLPLRLRRFRSGVMVVQDRGRSDERTCQALLSWLGSFKEVPPDAWVMGAGGEEGEVRWEWRVYGRGVTVKETAERFGWSLGVAGEELEMAEERGVLVREQDARGLKFWENHFLNIEVEVARHVDGEGEDEREVRESLERVGLI